jgi:hypothetical protein
MGLQPVSCRREVNEVKRGGAEHAEEDTEENQPATALHPPGSDRGEES